MAVWFVRTDGNNANDGRDVLGLGLATATYNDVGFILTQVGAFNGYAFTAGDVIYIASGTNATPGLYTIASRTDNDNIVLTASAGATDATGDWTSSDGPFATIAHAVDMGAAGNNALADGDEIRICANASHANADTIDIDTTGGSITLPILITGATALGLVDDTRATVDFSTTAGGENGFHQDPALAAASFIQWQHLRITGADGHNVAMDKSASKWSYYNCRIDNAGGMGVENNITSGGTGHIHEFFYCEIDSNGAAGIGISNDNRLGPVVWFCSIHDNTGDGIEIGSADHMDIYGSLFYDNGGHGIDIRRTDGSTASQGTRIINCVIDGNTGNGIQLVANNSGYGPMVINTVISNNGGFAIDLNGEDKRYVQVMYSWFYNNTSGDFSDSLTFASFWPNLGNTTGTDPKFTSIADGSEDYEPASDSGLINAGFPGAMLTGGTGYMDIGALQRQQAAGGGGLLTHPGMDGNLNG